MASLQQRLAECQNTATQLSNQLASMQQRVTEMESLISELNAQKLQLEAALVTEKAVSSQLAQQVEAMKIVLQNTTDALAVCKIQRDDLQAKYDLAEQSRQAVMTELATAQAQIADLEARLAAWEATVPPAPSDPAPVPAPVPAPPITNNKPVIRTAPLPGGVVRELKPGVSVRAIFDAAAAGPGGDLILVYGRNVLTGNQVGIRKNNITVLGASPDAEIVKEGGELFHISGSGCQIADMKLTGTGGVLNLIKLEIRDGVPVEGFDLVNVHYSEWDQRAVKSVEATEAANFRNVKIYDCLFTQSGPKTNVNDQYYGNYIAGLDLMGVDGLEIINNTFRMIQGATGEGRGAMQIWRGSRNVLIEGNTIVDCDAGMRIGVAGGLTGLVAHPYHVGSFIIRNNSIAEAPEEGIHVIGCRDGLIHNNVITQNTRNRYDRDWRLQIESSTNIVAENNVLAGTMGLGEPAPTPNDGNGTGLAAEYYDNPDLTNLKVTRVDPQVDFNWGDKSPDPTIAPDTFSARWVGEVMPRYSETYKFTTRTDDGARLWVNGVQLVNDWTNHGPTERTGTIALEAGKKYAIKMEYYDNSLGAVAQLFWSSPSQIKQIIPKTQLFPAAASTPTDPSPAPEPVPEPSPTDPPVPSPTEPVADPNITLTETVDTTILYELVKVRKYDQAVPWTTDKFRFWLVNKSDLAGRPVGLGLHSWGGDRVCTNDMAKTQGILWLVNINKSSIVLPGHSPIDQPTVGYDFWTGKCLADGKVHPVTQEQALAAYDYAMKRQSGDAKRAFVFGGSMGGSGAIAMAIRYPNMWAWVGAGVGVAIPAKSPTFYTTYEKAWQTKLGTVPPRLFSANDRIAWEVYDAAQRVRENPARTLPYMILSWGSNDNNIGWPQAVEFIKAMRSGRHGIAVRWSSTLGHGTRPIYPDGGEREQRVDLRTDQSFPALNNCSLDQDPETDLDGLIGYKLTWETTTIEDTTNLWSCTIKPLGHSSACTVDVTPRRLQSFKPVAGEILAVRIGDKTGQAVVDDIGLVTLLSIEVPPAGVRVTISRS